MCLSINNYINSKALFQIKMTDFVKIPDNYVKVPDSLLAKLNQIGNTFVTYSSFGPINIVGIRQKLNMSSEFGAESESQSSLMKFRSNPVVVEKTILGEMLGSSYTEEWDAHLDMYRQYSRSIPLRIMKLPSDLLDDEIFRFISQSNDKPEFLAFNIHKIHFNQDGSYVIF